MKNIILVVSLLLSVTFFTKCHKIEPTKTIITAVNESKLPLANVKVKISAQASKDQVKASTGIKADSAYTNAKGQVEFDFSQLYKDGQAGVAILDVEGIIINGSDSLLGNTYVQLEAGITKSVTLTLSKPKNN